MISFTNHGSVEETVAWASAQIHCQACFRDDVVNFVCSKFSPKSPATDTTFVPNRGIFLLSIVILYVAFMHVFNPGEKGHTLLSTPTTVLLCNLVLKPSDTKKGKFLQYNVISVWVNAKISVVMEEIVTVSNESTKVQNARR